MRNFIKNIFASRRNTYTGAILLLTGKACIFGLGYADAIFGIALLSVEGFLWYIDSHKTDKVDEQVLNRISSLESKFNLTNMRK